MLEVRGIDVFYGDAQALWAVDLHVDEGEIVCIVGPNGAGKSTLVQAIAGLLPVREGYIAVDGVDVSRLPAHRVCDRGVAIVPEGRRIFPGMTVSDNLDLGAYRPDARRRHAEMRRRVLDLFPRLEERSRQLAGSLSGGEQQMLAIGRALMACPRILLLDEPSLGLAPVIVDEVFDVIGEINRTGVAVLLVEQNVQRALEIASRAYLLSEGRVEMAGTAAEFIGDAELQRTVLGIGPEAAAPAVSLHEPADQAIGETDA
ncbi:MAG TPA: ABC transporter ATP-binding protein [Candidatus Limnocylindria bacterium]|nr:ABC transporter ATP-binding protein [Candidatus Limnocylindria bacterium]